MEDVRNLNLGEVYTPQHISNLLYKLTNKYISEFNKTHVVWDCCWGTGNLTSDYEFDQLYCSTLRMMDIKRHKEKNPGSTKFVYNFLEKDIEQLVSIQAMWTREHAMPEDLLDIFNGDKPIIFYINPPYVGTGVFGTNNTKFKDGATANAVKDIMQSESLESACDQTYTQFLYRIYLMKEAYKNKDISIAIICPPTFLSSTTYKNFRQKFLKEFKFMGGALFEAKEFSDELSDTWGISIQIWKPGETENKKEFNFDLYETADGGELEQIGTKKIYNLDGETTLVDWLKTTVDNKPHRLTELTLSSARNISGKKPINYATNALGYFYYRGNSIYHNEAECGLMSLPYSNGGGISVLEDNFDTVIATFTARRAFSRYGSTWINNKDEYAIPDINCEAYKALLMNGYIYSLFNGSSNMSSLILETEQGIVEVPNNFFFLSTDEMKNMLDSVGLPVIGPGNFENRIMYHKVQEALNSGLLEPKAYDIYYAWLEMWKNTMPLRQQFNMKEPTYQVLNWDAGFYQIRQIVKDRDLKDFTEMNKLYREFEESIRYLVYESGYLR